MATINDLKRAHQGILLLGTVLGAVIAVWSFIEYNKAKEPW